MDCTNFRTSNAWVTGSVFNSNTAALQKISDIIVREAAEAARIKPGQPGFVGAWAHAEALGYARDSFAWSLFLTTYLEKIKE